MLQHLTRFEGDKNGKYECAETYTLQSKIKTSFVTTIFIIKDSKYVCDAMRLMCLDSGERLHHADTLANAHRHLRLYVPNIVIIDEGLPYGFNSDFTAELHASTPRVDVIFGTSGDYMLHHHFPKTGANRFIEKPFISLSEFQLKMLSVLSESHFTQCLFPIQMRLWNQIQQYMLKTCKSVQYLSEYTRS